MVLFFCFEFPWRSKGDPKGFENRCGETLPKMSEQIGFGTLLDGFGRVWGAKGDVQGVSANRLLQAFLPSGAILAPKMARVPNMTPK